jgi:hypothetical protein
MCAASNASPFLLLLLMFCHLNVCMSSRFRVADAFLACVMGLMLSESLPPFSLSSSAYTNCLSACCLRRCGAMARFLPLQQVPRLSCEVKELAAGHVAAKPLETALGDAACSLQKLAWKPR